MKSLGQIERENEEAEARARRPNLMVEVAHAVNTLSHRGAGAAVLYDRQGLRALVALLRQWREAGGTLTYAEFHGKLALLFEAAVLEEEAKA